MDSIATYIEIFEDSKKVKSSNRDIVSDFNGLTLVFPNPYACKELLQKQSSSQ